MQGFLDDPDDVVANNASLAIEEAHPHCKVLPLSEMTVDRAGIDDGSITTLSATILVRSQNDVGRVVLMPILPFLLLLLLLLLCTHVLVFVLIAARRSARLRWYACWGRSRGLACRAITVR